MADDSLMAKCYVDMGVWREQPDGDNVSQKHQAGGRCDLLQLDITLGSAIADSLRAVAPDVALRAIGYALLSFEDEEDTRYYCDQEDYAAARNMVIAGSKLTGISYWNNPGAEEA